MNYLAINTAGKIEILVKHGDRYAYKQSDDKQLASATLLTCINDMLDKVKCKLEDLDVLGCVIGPGSFTGIRVGVSTVRALSYALKIPVLGVTYFDVLAYEYYACAGKKDTCLTVAIDGKSGVSYIKKYNVMRDAGCIMRGEDCKSGDGLCVLSSDIVKYSSDTLIADSRFSPLLQDCILPKDDGSGLKTAIEAGIKSKVFMHYSKLIPLYLRRSQPEREAGEL